MSLTLELLAKTRLDDLLREQRRLRLATLLARCRRAFLRGRRPSEACPT